MERRDPVRVEHRLAAILAADMVGYSRLMAADEADTLIRLKRLIAEFVEPTIAEHRGRLFKTMGDGLLVEFGSAIEAVKCAVTWQKGIAAQQPDLPDDRRMLFRIGINLGDVIIEGGDVFGDGVNVATRLQALAEPGGILVSGSLHEQVQGKVEFSFFDHGEQKLKNIPRPVRAYRVGAAATKPMVAPAALTALPALPDRPSIAVLPFDNMSSDPEQEYFADGITEDIITALSKWRWLLVIARNSTFTFRGTGTPVKQIAAELGARYVLEGSIRQAGGRIRVTAQLIEAATDRHVWAERFDRELRDVFAVQDEITQRVVSAIDPAIGISEIERAAHERSSDVHAWEHFLKGNYYYHRYNKRDMLAARAELQQAIDIDPHFAAAHARLAAAHAMDIAVGWAENLPESIAAIQRSANTAIALDDLDASAHVALAYARLHAREHEPAIAAARRAVELNPNYHDAYFALGLTLLAAGDAIPAAEAFGNALRLNPRDPAGWNQLGLAMSYYTNRQYEEAMQAVDRALADRPRFGGAKIIKSAILVRLGKVDEARGLLAEVPAAGFSQLVMFQLYRAKEDLEHYLAALEAAGWKRKRSLDD